MSGSVPLTPAQQELNAAQADLESRHPELRTQGSRQWLRQVLLIVAPASGKDGLDLSEMRIHFSAISRVTSVEPDILEARVYNLAPKTIDSLMAMSIVPPGQIVSPKQTFSVPASEATGLPGNKQAATNTAPAQVLLKAGYPGNFGTIFQGQLVQIRRGRESPMDDYVDIYAADGDASHRWGIMNTTLSAGWKAADIAKQAVKACEPYQLGGGDFPTDTDPAQTPGPRGRVCFGQVRDRLADIASTHRVEWWIHRNNLEFVPVSAYKPGDAIVINSKTGMIGLPQQTNFGVSVRCLLNPGVGRGSRIKIDNASVQRQQFSSTQSKETAFINSILASNLDADGVYKVLMVNHTGDTRANEWYTEAECITVDSTRREVLKAVPDPSLIWLAS